MKREEEHILQSKMALAQQGDQAAYRFVLESAEKLAFRYIAKRLTHTEDIEDILQEMLISIHKARHTYDSSRPFLPWLYAILNFRFQDYLRRHYRKAEYPSEHIEQLLQDETPSNEEIMEKRDLLEKYLSHLNEKQRSILTMIYGNGDSAQEVSNSLNISVSDVRVTAHRAIQKLKSLPIGELSS